MVEQGGYARDDLLVSTDWLAEHGRDRAMELIDCGTLDAYRRAHIPGAISLGGVNPFLKDPANEAYVMPPDQFGALMGRLGVGDDTLVVAYDDNNSLQAARLWWVLQFYGHAAARVLDGGWRKWTAEGRALSIEPAQPMPAQFTAREDDRVICRIDALRASIAAPDVTILDVRSDQEFAGTNARGNTRVGHVPGAAHIEWLDFMTKDTAPQFKSAEEIRSLLAAAGAQLDREVITYCQGGIRAAHVMFVLTLIGHDRTRNYDASMREWANREDTPLALPS